MPNSPIERLENCYRPPKKFAWRYENLDNISTSDHSLRQDEITSEPEEQSEMKFLQENGINTSPPVQQEPAMEPISPARQPEPKEDAPLDFSVKHDTAGPSNGRITSPSPPVTNGICTSGNGMTIGPLPMTMNYSECLKRLHNKSSMAFPGMVNGRSPPPPLMINGNFRHFEGNEELKRQDSELHNGNQSSMDYSEKSKEYLNGYGRMDTHGEITPRQTSPDHAVSSSEDNSLQESPILQGMLTAPVNRVSAAMKKININTSESFQRDNVNGIPLAMLSPVNNTMPLPVAPIPFFGGFGYMGPTVGSPAGLLAQGPEGSIIQALASKRQRKKKIDERPFKSYSFDELQEKLQFASSNPFAFGYNKQALGRPPTAPRSPQIEGSNESGYTAIGKSCPNGNGPNVRSENGPNINGSANESPEHINGAIDLKNICPNNGKDNTGDRHDSSPEFAEGANSRKRKITNEAEKDEAYWDRRRKNNLAAKRSREARRRKEDAIANMAYMYENHCTELSSRLASANYNYSELTVQYNRLLQENEAMKIQNNVLQERLSQKRCGQCGAKLPSVN